MLVLLVVIITLVIMVVVYVLCFKNRANPQPVTLMVPVPAPAAPTQGETEQKEADNTQRETVGTRALLQEGTHPPSSQQGVGFSPQHGQGMVVIPRSPPGTTTSEHVNGN